jgi:hypothetical protein
MLGANIALSAYEQARVQPALELVFYRPVRWITRVSWRTPYYLISRAPFNLYAIYTEPHDSQTGLVRWLESRFVGVFSRMLILDIPLRQIFLGKKLTVPRGHQAALLNGQFAPEVQALVERFHRPGGRDRLSGAANWLDYEERMRFIVSYFMIYQHGEPTMFDPPFKKPPQLHAPRELLPPPPPRGLRRLRVPLVVRRALQVKDPALEALRNATIEAKPLTLIDG